MRRSLIVDFPLQYTLNPLTHFSQQPSHRMASMKRPTSPSLPLFTDNATRITYLQRIKHDLTGHVSRKADALNNGLIPLLADLIRHPQSNDQVYTHAAQILAVL